MTYEQTLMEHEMIGFEKGFAQGFVKEYMQGFAQDYLQDIEHVRAIIVMHLLKRNISLAGIAFGLELTVDEVTAIIKKFNLKG